MAPSDRVLALLGLAARAGAVVPGTQRVREAVRAGAARYAVVAVDASANAIDKLVPLLERRHVPHARAYSREEIGVAVGRSPLSAVAIAERGFADRLAALIEERTEVEAGKPVGPDRAS